MSGSPKFDITGDTTLSELAGMMRLLPEFVLHVEVNPGFVRTQRYEVSVTRKGQAFNAQNDVPTDRISERGVSLQAALSKVMERALALHIGNSNPPGEEE